jgi:hypothetical protein
MAFIELVWYATGQMPQIRAVMSGASRKERPWSSASKKRGGSKIRSSTLSTSVAQPHAHRALSLDSRQVVGADLAALSHSLQPAGKQARPR